MSKSPPIEFGHLPYRPVASAVPRPDREPERRQCECGRPAFGDTGACIEHQPAAKPDRVDPSSHSPEALATAARVNRTEAYVQGARPLTADWHHRPVPVGEDGRLVMEAQQDTPVHTRSGDTFSDPKEQRRRLRMITENEAQRRYFAEAAGGVAVDVLELSRRQIVRQRDKRRKRG